MEEQPDSTRTERTGNTEKNEISPDLLNLIEEKFTAHQAEMHAHFISQQRKYYRLTVQVAVLTSFSGFFFFYQILELGLQLDSMWFWGLSMLFGSLIPQNYTDSHRWKWVSSIGAIAGPALTFGGLSAISTSMALLLGMGQLWNTYSKDTVDRSVGDFFGYYVQIGLLQYFIFLLSRFHWNLVTNQDMKTILENKKLEFVRQPPGERTAMSPQGNVRMEIRWRQDLRKMKAGFSQESTIRNDQINHFRAEKAVVKALCDYIREILELIEALSKSASDFFSFFGSLLGSFDKVRQAWKNEDRFLEKGVLGDEGKFIERIIGQVEKVGRIQAPKIKLPTLYRILLFYHELMEKSSQLLDALGPGTETYFEPLKKKGQEILQYEVKTNEERTHIHSVLKLFKDNYSINPDNRVLSLEIINSHLVHEKN